MNQVPFDDEYIQSILRIAESTGDVVARGAAQRLTIDSVPWSFDTLRTQMAAVRRRDAQ